MDIKMIGYVDIVRGKKRSFYNFRPKLTWNQTSEEWEEKLPKKWANFTFRLDNENMSDAAEVILNDRQEICVTFSEERQVELKEDDKKVIICFSDQDVLTQICSVSKTTDDLNDADDPDVPTEGEGNSALEATQSEQEVKLPTTEEIEAMTSLELCEYLCREVKRYRPSPEYSRNEILSIAIAMTQNFLTVFSGEPGTGKTSICNIFAQVLGLRKPRDTQEQKVRYVSVSVERGWTSKRDFIGYHNPLSHDVVLANSRLYDALKDAEVEKDNPLAPLLILLDEANLSPMEYYWSDFMDIAGGDEDEVERVIELGGALGQKKPGESTESAKSIQPDESAEPDDSKKSNKNTEPDQIEISPACRFFATINNDHTTERLSPRIIDRAAVVSLPKGEFEEGKPLKITDGPFGRISWEKLEEVFGCKEEKPPALDDEAAEIYAEIKENLLKYPLNAAVSPRVEKAIRRFWYAAKQVFDGDRDIAALDYAVAQRLLPKLEGGGETFEKALKDLKEFCESKGLEKCGEILKDILRRGDTGGAALNYYSFF